MGYVTETPAHTLLEPGHQVEWKRLNEEKRRLLTPAPDAPVSELLRRGQRLSAQAAALLRAVERAGGRLPIEPIPGVDD